MSAIDQKIDDLYALPLAAFTAERNALARTLSGDDATRVKRLPKPAVVPWAVNQVYWRARPTYDRVIKTGERLRHAQIAALKGKAADVRSATDDHRAAIAAAVAAAERFAADADSHPPPDALARTFEALSLAAEPPAHPGRLAEPLQPAGFEALAGITPQPALKREGSSPAKKTGHARPEKGARDREQDHRRDAAEAKREADEHKKREAAVKTAEAALARAQAAERLAHDAWLRTQREVDAARQALTHAKSER